MTRPSTTAHLGGRGDDQRGARVWRTKDRAAALYSAGPKTPTMMQCGASQRSSEAADPFFRSALKPWAQRGPRHLEPSSATRRNGRSGPKPSGILQQISFSVRDEEERPPAPRHRERSARARSEACALRLRPSSCASRGLARCGRDTTAPAHCPSGSRESARPVAPCPAAPGRCRLGRALSPGVCFRFHRASP